MLPERDATMLLVLAGLAVAVRLLAAVERVQQKVSTRTAARIFPRFAVDFYDHIQRLDLAFFSDTKMGEFRGCPIRRRK